MIMKYLTFCVYISSKIVASRNIALFAFRRVLVVFVKKERD
jgi:hypothetical protein